jgi:hypothetical protein
VTLSDALSKTDGPDIVLTTKNNKAREESMEGEPPYFLPQENKIRSFYPKHGKKIYLPADVVGFFEEYLIKERKMGSDIKDILLNIANQQIFLVSVDFVKTNAAEVPSSASKVNIFTFIKFFQAIKEIETSSWKVPGKIVQQLLDGTRLQKVGVKAIQTTRYAQQYVNAFFDFVQDMAKVVFTDDFFEILNRFLNTIPEQTFKQFGICKKLEGLLRAEAEAKLLVPGKKLQYVRDKYLWSDEQYLDIKDVLDLHKIFPGVQKLKDLKKEQNFEIGRFFNFQLELDFCGWRVDFGCFFDWMQDRYQTKKLKISADACQITKNRTMFVMTASPLFVEVDQSPEKVYPLFVGECKETDDVVAQIKKMADGNWKFAFLLLEKYYETYYVADLKNIWQMLGLKWPKKMDSDKRMTSLIQNIIRILPILSFNKRRSSRFLEMDFCIFSKGNF